MAHPYLSDPIEATWDQPKHETFEVLAERIEDYLNTKGDMGFNPQYPTEYDDLTHEFDPDSLDCLMAECEGPCLMPAQGDEERCSDCVYEGNFAGPCEAHA